MEEKRINYSEFRFMPYLPLEQDIKFGDVIFWPYYRRKNIFIRKKEVQVQLEKYLKKYVDNFSKKSPLKKITIASYGKGSNFRPLNAKEESEVLDAVRVLSFCILICNHPPYHAFSLENFQIVCQRFRVGDNRIATHSGSYHSIQIQGQQIEDAIFIQPLYIYVGPYVTCDKKIIEAIEKLRSDAKNRTFYRRVVDSLRWVSYACTNIDGFPYASRIVMMMIAFEILLGGFNGKFDLMKKFYRYLCDAYDNWPKNRAKRSIYIDGKKVEKEYSRIEWWAYDFYMLRNKIVHGRQVNDKDYINKRHRDYFSLAIKFFREILIRELSERGCYDYNNDVNLLEWVGIYDEI